MKTKQQELQLDALDLALSALGMVPFEAWAIVVVGAVLVVPMAIAAATVVAML